jgi:hypothetical protein
MRIPYLHEEVRGLLVLVLVVHAACRLAWIGGVADGAVFPVEIVVELALEVEGVVDGGEAEIDVVALVDVLV